MQITTCLSVLLEFGARAIRYDVDCQHGRSKFILLRCRIEVTYCGAASSLGHLLTASLLKVLHIIILGELQERHAMV